MNDQENRFSREVSEGIGLKDEAVPSRQAMSEHKEQNKAAKRENVIAVRREDDDIAAYTFMGETLFPVIPSVNETRRQQSQYGESD